MGGLALPTSGNVYLDANCFITFLPGGAGSRRRVGAA